MGKAHLSRAGLVALAASLCLVGQVSAAGPGRSTVGLAKGTDYAKTVREAVEAAGGLKGLIKVGSTVFIKPNIVAPVAPGIGHITDYRVVQEVVKLAKEAGAKRIIIGEHTNPDDNELALATSRIGNIKGVEFFDTNTDTAHSYLRKAPNSLTGLTWTVPKAWVDADVVISVPVMKTHNIAGVTLALKNVGIGIPPIDTYGTGQGWKATLHDISVPKTIADICQIRRIDFAIIDGMVAGEGDGPGSPKPVKMNVIVAGRDPVAVDSVGSRIMGIDPNLITHIAYSEGVGLGTMDPDRIDVKGATVAGVAKKLARAPQNNYPYKMTTYASPLPDGFVLDGATAEWKGARMAKLAAGAFSLSYNDGTLYVAGNIADDKVVAGKDGVSVDLSFKNPFEPDKNQSRKKHDARYDFSIHAAVPAAPGQVTLKDIDGRSMGTALFRTVEGGYQFEAAISLKASANLSLAYGEELWVDFGVTNANAGGDSTTVYWAGPGSKETNPTTLGRAICLVK